MPSNGLGVQPHQTARTAGARAEVPAARTVPRIDNGVLFGVSYSALLDGARLQSSARFIVISPLIGSTRSSNFASAW
jgi:hypothetical protein